MLTRWLIYILIFLFSGAGEAFAAISCGTATTNTTEGDPQTIVFTPDAGSNRIVVVAIAVRDSTNPTNTINGVSSNLGGTWTQYALASNGGTPPARAAIYYSTNFASGSQTLSVDYTIASPTQGTIGVYTCTGVDTVSPWRASATTGSGSGTSGSINVSSAVGDVVVDVLALSGSTGDALTIGAGQTSKYNLSNGGVNLIAGASTEDGAATTTMSWSWVNSRPWVSVGGSLKEAAVAASVRNRGAVLLP